MAAHSNGIHILITPAAVITPVSGLLSPIVPVALGGGDIYYFYKVAKHETQLSKSVTGRPDLTALINLIEFDLEARGKSHRLGSRKPRSSSGKFPSVGRFSKANMSRFPALQVNGLSSVREDPDNATPTERTAEREDRKLAMLRRMRPPPLKYAWAFYHDKHSDSGSYEGRLSLVMENIVTLKPFWGVLNNFPIHALKMKDSVHFFKRGVKPVWEDSRNINGGSWTFRVPKDKSEQFWQEVLMLAVGEQFAAALQPRKSPEPEVVINQLLMIRPGDDICGVTFSARFNSNLITIWNRDGSNQKSIDNILATVLEKVTPELKPKEGSYYYKKHSEHAGYEEVVGAAKERARKKLEAHEVKETAKKQEAIEKEDKIEDAIVTEEEGNKALLKDAEGEDVEGMVEKERKGSSLKGEVKADDVKAA